MNNWRSTLRLIALLVAATPTLIACAVAGASTTPRPTAVAIIAITPAPTLQIDATATVYARQLIATPTPAGVYIVQRGDTLSGIATQFGLTVAELAAANGLTDPNAIIIGQTILIPSIGQGTPVRGTLPPVVVGSPTLTPTVTPQLTTP
jgi:LysM repeat protein